MANKLRIQIKSRSHFGVLFHQNRSALLMGLKASSKHEPKQEAVEEEGDRDFAKSSS